MSLEDCVNEAYSKVFLEDFPVDDRRFFVEQGDEDGTWEVRRFHNEEPSKTGFDSKEAAIEAAKDMAREASGPESKAQVKIRSGGSFSKVIDFVDGDQQ
jgi:hypothetical protein